MLVEIDAQRIEARDGDVQPQVKLGFVDEARPVDIARHHHDGALFDLPSNTTRNRT